MQLTYLSASIGLSSPSQHPGASTNMTQKNSNSSAFAYVEIRWTLARAGSGACSGWAQGSSARGPDLRLGVRMSQRPNVQGIGQRCIGREGAAETLTLLVESACGVRTHAHCSKTVPKQSEKNNPATLLRPRSTASRMPNLHSPHLKLNHPGSFITFSAPLLALQASAVQSTGGEHVAMPKFQGIGQRCIGHEGAAETLTLLVESACGVRAHAHCSKTVPEQSEKNNQQRC